MLRLSDLAVGETARVKEVEENHAISERLVDIGLVPGTAVEVVRFAPFGSDPILIRMRGALFGLRKSEASIVKVEKADGN